jgi:hypothetical protein
MAVYALANAAIAATVWLIVALLGAPAWGAAGFAALAYLISGTLGRIR